MANMLIPVEERNLTPQEVEALDRRRRRGQLFLVLCFQCIIVGTLVTLWSGQDLAYSPGWARPMSTGTPSSSSSPPSSASPASASAAARTEFLSY